ncbi:hypothetical protein ACOZ32_13560 (plasmid) [Halobacterium sp. MBLA0001]|uniref:hypothetical protein n=1 Tax=Halobacterium sp. MBLA0001 TaxID=3413511 RepID=UPI003C707AF0
MRFTDECFQLSSFRLIVSVWCIVYLNGSVDHVRLRLKGISRQARIIPGEHPTFLEVGTLIEQPQFGAFTATLLLVDANEVVRELGERVKLDEERRHDTRVWISGVTDECGFSVDGFAEFVRHRSEPNLVVAAITAEHKIGRDARLGERGHSLVDEPGNL